MSPSSPLRIRPPVPNHSTTDTAGEAAAVVSVVHKVKRPNAVPPLRIDGRGVARVSAFLVNDDNDDNPMPLAANDSEAFIATYTFGMGFAFGNVVAATGAANTLAEMDRLIAQDPRNAERIKRCFGGEEVNTLNRSGFAEGTNS